jgi:peptidoglycan/xylan/chitin deacetylase (PgdA/CDA1 family)
MRAILTYHSIDSTGSPISVGIEAFGRHVAWLASGRVSVEPLPSLVTGDETTGDGRDRVALTFDDAFANFATVAWPRLAGAGLAATVFVVTGHVGGTNRWGGHASSGIPELPLLDWDGLARCMSDGADVGAHSRTHPPLTTLAPAELADEIDGSRRDLAERLGVRASSFAYPYGDVSEFVVARTTPSFELACTTDYRPVDPGDARHRLPRLDMFYFQHPQAFEDWGQPSFRRRVAMRRAARAVRSWCTPRHRHRPTTSGTSR